MLELRHAGKIAALVIAVPTTAALLYWLFLRSDDDEVDDDNPTKVETSRQTVIRVAVNSKHVGTVIGPQGATIKRIQEESGARLHFTDRNSDGDEDRTVLIRGDTESAQKAELMIRQMLADMPATITEEVEVPGYCIGRIIGRGGESIREMSRVTKCKIFIDRTQEAKGSHAPRTITITGPHTYIQLAKSLIEEKVEEEEAFRAKMAVRVGNREERKPVKRRAEGSRDKPSLPSKVVETEGSWDAGDATHQLGAAGPVKEFMEVFVSAVEHPGHFWVQIITSASLQLDKLTDDMTAFYSNPATAQEYAVSEVKEGEVVAAPFEEDKTWCRARVLEQVDDQVDLYYFDFGDSEMVSMDSLRELKPEYLSLPVQAIECKLANVKPTEEEWSDEACLAFEELTHCAKWKVLSARTEGYDDDLPCIQLVDNAPDQPVDVAAELVTRGLAAWEAPPPSAVTTETVRPDLV